MEQETMVQRVLSAITTHPDCDLDTLTGYCKGLTWNQVLSAVDQLTRRGVIRMRRPSRGLYLFASLETASGASVDESSSSEEATPARSHAPETATTR